MVSTASRALAFAAGLSLSVAGLTSVAQAQQPEIAPDTVIATVNGEDVTMAEVERLRASDQRLQQVPMAALIKTPMFNNMVEYLVGSRLILEKAKSEGFQDDPEVKQQMDAVRDEIIRTVFLERLADEATTEEAIAAKYEAFKESTPTEEEVRAAHILVETEEEARALIKQLEDGADFADLAKSESTGPSAPKGGDLGYFKREGQMVEPFAKAAFDLEAGAFTKEPVETQFGWHIIQVTDRRMSEPPALDEVRDQLANEIAQETLTEFVENLRASAEVETKTADELLPPAEE